jgi:hypothetical protein
MPFDESLSDPGKRAAAALHTAARASAATARAKGTTAAAMDRSRALLGQAVYPYLPAAPDPLRVERPGARARPAVPAQGEARAMRPLQGEGRRC